MQSFNLSEPMNCDGITQDALFTRFCLMLTVPTIKLVPATKAWSPTDHGLPEYQSDMYTACKKGPLIRSINVQVVNFFGSMSPIYLSHCHISSTLPTSINLGPMNVVFVLKSRLSSCSMIRNLTINLVKVLKSRWNSCKNSLVAA